MKLLTYTYRGQTLPGFLDRAGTGIVPCGAVGLPAGDMPELILAIGEKGLPALPEHGSILLAAAELRAAMPRPRQDILCLGLNYHAHAQEAARYRNDVFGEKKQAVYFSKRATRVIGPGEPIPSHAPVVDSLDYEAELAVILGRDAKNVAPEAAYDYVLGYAVFNDVSARNVQAGHSQWYFGKSMDGFSAMGHYIVTRDELPQPPDLGIRSYVNGELRQSSNTALMIFDVPWVLAELSRDMTLLAGTVIAMGTPAGVGMGMTPPCFLQPGDMVRCEIDGIGALENPVVK